MNLDKAKKRLAKKAKMGFKGYPLLSLSYFGETPELATKVTIAFTLEEGAAAQEQSFTGANVKEDESIQSALVKILERTDAKSLVEEPGIAII